MHFLDKHYFTKIHSGKVSWPTLHVKSVCPIWNRHLRKAVKVLETRSLLLELNHRALTMQDSMIPWPCRLLDSTTPPWTAISCTLARAGQRGKGARPGGAIYPPLLYFRVHQGRHCLYFSMQRWKYWMWHFVDVQAPFGLQTRNDSLQPSSLC